MNDRQPSTAPDQPQAAIGIDLGGTKCAIGLVAWPTGTAVGVQQFPTEAARGGRAVLLDVERSIEQLLNEARERHWSVTSIGIGLPELVDGEGRICSAATIDWISQPERVDRLLAQRFACPVHIEADVRAAARAEAALGAGQPYRQFIYVSVGTGISCSLVLAGEPYLGARGLTGTFASAPQCLASWNGELISGPPLEQYAGGPALAARMEAVEPSFRGTATELLQRAAEGDQRASAIVRSGGTALGASLAQLVNLLDPEAIVIGGGLGLAPGEFRDGLEQALRAHIWSDLHRHVPLCDAALGTRAGLIGAALAAATRAQRR